MALLKWEIEYNSMKTGKQFFTKKECKKEWQRLYNLGLYGYTIRAMS